jgi:hypothetical protein
MSSRAKVASAARVVVAFLVDAADLAAFPGLVASMKVKVVKEMRVVKGPADSEEWVE